MSGEAIRQQCSNCMFWVGRPEMHPDGKCRRFPRLPVAIDGEPTYFLLPEMGYDEWCGEWKPREPKA